MKKSIFIISLFALIMAGCSKEKNIEPISNNAPTDFSNVKVITYNNGLKTGITMLEFPSISAYEKAISILNQQMKTYDSTFFVLYSNLSEEAYDAKQTEVGYNEQQPLIDAEISLSFVNSMRQSYVDIENTWMSNTELDMATYPKKEYPFSFAEMTLLNSSGEVKIGNAILKLTKNGYLWISLINNISVSLSLYSLVLFYMATEERLKPFKPLMKFLCVKTIIFFSYWQSCLFNILKIMGIFDH